MGNLTSLMFHLQTWIVVPGSCISPWDWKGFWVAGYCWDARCPIICTDPSCPLPECLIFILDLQKPFVRLWILQPRVLSPGCNMGSVFSGLCSFLWCCQGARPGFPGCRSYKLIFIYNPGASLVCLEYLPALCSSEAGLSCSFIAILVVF